jgi:hypothetical protein
MSASEPLFCFTSNKIEMHPCSKCRAPMMLSRTNSARLDLDARRFECFNCDNVVVIPTDQVSL